MTQGGLSWINNDLVHQGTGYCWCDSAHVHTAAASATVNPTSNQPLGVSQ